jgi:dipeptidyl aminopeptidase/acylaminoacyl peptidase
MLLHNDRDGSVRYEQSRSFFIVLRELQKPAWWLNYHGKDHHVTGQQQKLDYNIKIKEFFDHYLKGAEMPTWMKEHI